MEREAGDAVYFADSRRRRIITSVVGTDQILAWGSSYYLLAVLAAPISAETGWPLPWVVGGQTVGLLVAGSISPRVGRTIDRHGGRPVLAASTVVLSLGLFLLAAAPNIVVYIAAWAILGVGMGAGLYDAAFATLGRYFGSKARPTITTVTLFGGFASTLAWPLIAYLSEHLGWRGACAGLAIINLGITLPLLLVLLPHAPVRSVAATGSGGPEEVPRKERLAFLLLAAVQVVGGTITAIVSVHLLTLLQERGVTLAQAVALGVLIGPAQVAARVIEMAGGGRHHPLWTLTAAMGFIAAGLLMLWTGLSGVAGALILYGAGNGIYSIARGTVPLALFGPERYARLVGKLAAPSLLAQAISPPIAAIVLARAGASTTFAVLLVLAVIALLLVAVLWFVAPNTSGRMVP